MSVFVFSDSFDQIRTLSLASSCFDAESGLPPALVYQVQLFSLSISRLLIK